MEAFVLWSWTLQFHCSKKKTFLTVFWQQTIFCHENGKPSWQTTYTIWKLGSREFVLACWARYHHIQIIGLEFLQRCGHQIRVTTWTGSYEDRWYFLRSTQKDVYRQWGEKTLNWSEHAWSLLPWVINWKKTVRILARTLHFALSWAKSLARYVAGGMDGSAE